MLSLNSKFSENVDNINERCKKRNLINISEKSKPTKEVNRSRKSQKYQGFSSFCHNLDCIGVKFLVADRRVSVDPSSFISIVVSRLFSLFLVFVISSFSSQFPHRCYHNHRVHIAYLCLQLRYSLSTASCLGTYPRDQLPCSDQAAHQG